MSTSSDLNIDLSNAYTHQKFGKRNQMEENESAEEEKLPQS